MKASLSDDDKSLVLNGIKLWWNEPGCDEEEKAEILQLIAISMIPP